jgi:hypothetical protein
MKFLLEFIKTLLGRTSKTKGLNNNVKSEIVTMLDEATESVLKGTKKIDDQIAELKRIEAQIFKAEETAGEIIPGDRPQRMSAVMYDSPERSIQFVAEKTGLDVGRAKAAVVEKMNEAYPAGSPKRATMDDDDMIKAYLDNNLRISSKTDAVDFLDELEEIGKGLDDNVVNINDFILKKAEDIDEILSPAASKEKAKGIIASADAPDPADLGLAKRVDVDDAKLGTRDDLEFTKFEAADEVDALKADQFVDETVETRRRLQELDKGQVTDLAGDMAKQVTANERKISKLIEAGEFEKARQLEEINEKTLSKMREGIEDLDEILPNFPFDPDKPKMAEGGRIGFEPGGDVPGKGKLPISRRGFLGVLGGGLAALATGGKGLLPAAKTGITAAKTLSAPGMPKWFPLLVTKIQTKGNLVSPAVPNKGEVNAVYKYKDGKTEYEMVENSNTGEIDIFTRGADGQQVSFEYAPEQIRLLEDGTRSKTQSQFGAGEYMKGHEGGSDIENFADNVDELNMDISNIEDFAIRGTTQKVDNAIEDFIKKTRTEEPGFNQGGLVPPQAGPMASGMGSLFRQRTA